MRVVYFCSGEIGLPVLRWLGEQDSIQLTAVVTQPDRPSGRGLKTGFSAIKQLALDLQCPVQQPEKARHPDAIEALRRLSADVFVVMAYGQILPASLLELPRLACLNLHASLLPSHRGASPIHAAIRSGEAESGITVMHMAAGLDTGDIFLKHSLPIRRRETVGTLHDRLALLAVPALEEALAALRAGRAVRIPQEEHLATYAGKLSRADAQIDWQLPACEVERHIRAMTPWPGAWTRLGPEGPVLKINSAIVCRKLQGAPGEVLPSRHGALTVACGEGALLLKNVQLEGRRKMDSTELLRGHPIEAGLNLSSCD